MTNTPDPTTTRRGSRFVPAFLLAASLLLLGAACGGDDSGSSDSAGSDAGSTDSSESVETTEVEIADFTFTPGAITVAAGDTVTWTTSDSSPHTVKDQSDAELAESDDLRDGDTFELTYDEPGEYPYICGIHNYMTGTVTVQ